MGELKYREHFATTLPKDIIKQIKQLSKDTDIPISRLVEKALKEYLAKNDITRQ